jgi:hypothetical protein
MTMMTRSGARAVTGAFVKDVLENPCIAQCITKHILNSRNGMSLYEEGTKEGVWEACGDDDVCKTLFSFSCISKDARFHEAIEPSVRRARYRYFLRQWISVFQVRSKSYWDQEAQMRIRMMNGYGFVTMTYAVANLMEQRNGEFAVHMKKLTDFMRNNIDLMCENPRFKVVMCLKIIEMMDQLPDFKDEGFEFLALPGMGNEEFLN